MDLKHAAPLASTIRIVVCGAGMGGLATALALARKGFQHIDVYETASNLGFVGAGIQVAPNLARVLNSLGVWEHIKKEAVRLDDILVRDGPTDEELSHAPLSHIEELYGFPHCVAHRSSLAGGLFEACKTLPSITFHFSTSVTDIDFDAHRIRTRARGEAGDGTWVEADVVLAADGVKSLIRKQMLARHGEEDDAKDTGQAAYRVMLTREQIAHDPELIALLESHTAYRWIGARRNVIAYPISSQTILNVSTAQPDIHFAAEPSATWTATADKGEMLDVWSDFCSRARKLFALVPEGDVCEWKLRVHHALDSWVEGNVALVGDACHPTLPHLAQGAAQAIEDAAVLGVVLSKISEKADIHAALVVYERLRKTRAMYLVEQAAASGRAMHETDPAAQAERNEAFRQVKHGGPNPDRWADRKVQDYVYGHDCIAEAEKHFDEYFKAERNL